MANSQSKAEHELAVALVAALNLEGTQASDIDPVAPLFGYDDAKRGLGLDSIDALEIALVIQQKYGVQMRSEDPEVKRAFGSLRHLTAHVQQHAKA
jgi:acyl carrier protein